jgi:hypothetical protein
MGPFFALQQGMQLGGPDPFGAPAAQGWLALE